MARGYHVRRLLPIRGELLDAAYNAPVKVTRPKKNELSPQQRRAGHIKWLDARGRSMKAICAELDVDYDTVYRVVCGIAHAYVPEVEPPKRDGGTT